VSQKLVRIDLGGRLLPKLNNCVIHSPASQVDTKRKALLLSPIDADFGLLILRGMQALSRYGVGGQAELLGGFHFGLTDQFAGHHQPAAQGLAQPCHPAHQLRLCQASLKDGNVEQDRLVRGDGSDAPRGLAGVALATHHLHFSRILELHVAGVAHTLRCGLGVIAGVFLQQKGAGRAGAANQSVAISAMVAPVCECCEWLITHKAIGRVVIWHPYFLLIVL